MWMASTRPTRDAWRCAAGHRASCPARPRGCWSCCTAPPSQSLAASPSCWHARPVWPADPLPIPPTSLFASETGAGAALAGQLEHRGHAALHAAARGRGRRRDGLPRLRHRARRRQSPAAALPHSAIPRNSKPRCPAAAAAAMTANKIALLCCAALRLAGRHRGGGARPARHGARCVGQAWGNGAGRGYQRCATRALRRRAAARGGAGTDGDGHAGRLSTRVAGARGVPARRPAAVQLLHAQLSCCALRVSSHCCRLRLRSLRPRRALRKAPARAPAARAAAAWLSRAWRRAVWWAMSRLWKCAPWRAS